MDLSKILIVADELLPLLMWGDTIGMTGAEVEQVQASALAGKRVELIEALDYGHCVISGAVGRCHRVKVVALA